MKTAIVTGAAGNLGKAVVEKLLTEGYRVSGTLAAGEASPFAAHAAFSAHTVDLGDEAAANGFVSTVIAASAQLDVAVLTVGGFAMGSIADTSAADLLKQYQLNFATAYNVARPVFLQMLQQSRGRIFLIGSKPGLAPATNGKGMVAYSLAKSLIFRLAEIFNAEAAGHNVVVTVVVPSAIDTPQNRKSMPNADHSKWVTAAAIADNIAWLCSDAADAIREPILKMYNNG